MPPVKFGSIEGDWSDRPVALVATGPSLAGFDLNRLKGLCRVIAIKEMIFDLPWADEGFGLDLTWMAKGRRQKELDACRIPLVLAVPNEGLAMDLPSERAGITFIERKRGEQLSDDRRYIYAGGTSGFGALNLPYLRGAKDWFLFGYDYATPGGKHHCDERRYPNAQNHGHWVAWARKYNLIADQIARAGIRVWNASPDSAITAFAKVSHDDAIDRLHRF
jgi:hypothetical protein